MSCFFRRIGVTLKKTLVVREQDRPDIKRDRKRVDHFASGLRRRDLDP
jgi:hypothetical protein